jgi:hypothetical protein
VDSPEPDGRPPVSADVAALIERLAAGKAAGGTRGSTELLKLAYAVRASMIPPDHKALKIPSTAQAAHRHDLIAPRVSCSCSATETGVHRPSTHSWLALASRP